MKIKIISDTELEFMEMVWKSNEDLSLQDFMNRFNDRNWERETYSSYLHKLCTKGYITKYRIGRVFYYKPLISQLEYEQLKINKSLEKVYGTSLEGLIATFCGKKDIKPEKLDKIREWLKELTDDQ